MTKKILFIFFSLIFNHCTGVIILVHGSFASKADWARPYGDFYQTLEAQAKTINQALISFSWSGKPTHKELHLAGERLAQLIKSYPSSERIILIGHSHGGNVINLASKSLHDPMPAIFSSQLPSITTLLTQAESNATTSDASSFLDVTLLGKPEFSVSATLCKQDPQLFLIKRVYLLGTPVDCMRYAPCMKTIQHLYNFYSLGDLIQPVGGLFKRTYPTTLERVHNIMITITGAGRLGKNYPTHSGIHHKIIAKWILHIPLELQKEKIGNFENYKENGGSIHFEENKPPKFMLMKSVEQDAALPTHQDPLSTLLIPQAEKI